jgi:hypothetical protein
MADIDERHIVYTASIAAYVPFAGDVQNSLRLA